MNFKEIELKPLSAMEISVIKMFHNNQELILRACEHYHSIVDNRLFLNKGDNNFKKPKLFWAILVEQIQNNGWINCNGVVVNTMDECDLNFVEGQGKSFDVEVFGVKISLKNVKNNPFEGQKIIVKSGRNNNQPEVKDNEWDLIWICKTQDKKMPCAFGIFHYEDLKRNDCFIVNDNPNDRRVYLELSNLPINAKRVFAISDRFVETDDDPLIIEEDERDLRQRESLMFRQYVQKRPVKYGGLFRHKI